MKVQILDIRSQTNSKTGEVTHSLLVLTDVVKYGSVKKDAIEVRVDNPSLYKIGDADLDILLPYQEYPYKLKTK